MNYKMVVLDLDGTLLDENKTISRRSREVLSKLREKNIEVVVATGRRHSFAKTVLEKVGFPVTILSSGGTMVRNSCDNSKIMARYLDDDLFYDIVRKGREYCLHPLIHADKSEEGYDFLLEYEKEHPCYNSYLTDSIKEYRVVGDFLEYCGGGIMLMCFMGEKSKLESLQASVAEMHGDKLHCHILTTLKRIGPVLEIMSPAGTKWNTLVDYARSLGIRPCQIVAIGDDNNDIEMIKYSGLGIAMKNATEEAKAGAKAVTLHTNSEDGAALALAGVFGLPL